MVTSMHTKPVSHRNFQAGFTIYDKISGHTTNFLPWHISKFSSYNISQLLKRMCIAPLILPSSFPHKFYLSSFPHKFYLSSFPHKFYIPISPHKFYLSGFPHKFYLLSFPHKFYLLNFPHKFYLSSFPYKFYLSSFPPKYHLSLSLPHTHTEFVCTHCTSGSDSIIMWSNIIMWGNFMNCTDIFGISVILALHIPI